jgi:hypothetical protein
VHCDNCGTELFTGQRFCRSCGRATDDFSEESTPTQRMPPEHQVRGARDTATATPSRADTSPVYTPPDQNYYQPYTPIQHVHPMPPYTPPRSRSPWGWIVALIALFLIGAVGLGAFVISRASRTPAGSSRGIPSPPPPPPPPGTEETIVGGGLTVDTRGFPFAARGGNLTLETIKGDVSIEGWDESRAEVQVTKNANTDVRFMSDGKNLTIKTEPRGGGVDVKYIIKVPRNVGKVEIKAATSDINLSDLTGKVGINNGSGSVTLSDINGDIGVNTGSGDISLSDVKGEIGVNSGSGSIKLIDVSGKVDANTASGDLDVSFVGENREPLSLNTASGDIQVHFDSDVNADIDVKTLTGDINLDEGFGINVRNTRPVGKEARGRIGGGGQPISINTMSGDVTITKE